MIARGGGLVWMNNPPSVSWSSSQNGLIEIQNGGYSLVILLWARVPQQPPPNASKFTFRIILQAHEECEKGGRCVAMQMSLASHSYLSKRLLLLKGGH